MARLISKFEFICAVDTLPLVPIYSSIICNALLLFAKRNNRPAREFLFTLSGRIRKLIHSNNILPKYLVETGYDYKYTLDEAFADWKKDCPEELI